MPIVDNQVLDRLETYRPRVAPAMGGSRCWTARPGARIGPEEPPVAETPAAESPAACPGGPPAPPDLPPESPTAHHERAGSSTEVLLHRARFLEREDRLLVELCLEDDVTLHRIAQVLKVAPGTVTRRLQRILARLRDPIVPALLDGRCPLSPEHRQVGIEHFLQGLSARKIAEKHRLRPHFVAGMLEHLRGWQAARQGVRR